MQNELLCAQARSLSAQQRAARPEGHLIRNGDELIAHVAHRESGPVKTDSELRQVGFQVRLGGLFRRDKTAAAIAGCTVAFRFSIHV